jgi:hypothetical protein
MDKKEKIFLDFIEGWKFNIVKQDNGYEHLYISSKNKINIINFINSSDLNVRGIIAKIRLGGEKITDAWIEVEFDIWKVYDIKFGMNQAEIQMFMEEMFIKHFNINPLNIDYALPF